MASFVGLGNMTGFIGCGNMAQAIGFAAISQGVLKPSDIMVSAPSDRNLSIWKEKGVQTTHNNGEVISKCNLIFIAVKPQYFQQSISSAASSFTPNTLAKKCFVSIMVGCNIIYIRQVLSESFPGVHLVILRVMPNTPLLVGKGFSALCTEGSKDLLALQAKERTIEILKAGGLVEEVKEFQMNALSAISGSGPAYIYTVIEALADGGVRCGLPRSLALRVAACTMEGGAAMVLERNEHPAVLRDAVCSPGGTTIAAMHSLERHGIRAAFMDAVEAAVKRASELG